MTGPVRPVTLGDLPHQIGDYRLVQLVGHGQLGTVVRAQAMNTNDTDHGPIEVAIKLIHPEWVHFPSFREQFLKYVEKAQSIQHPHVAAVLGSVSEGSWLGMVSEWVEGKSLVNHQAFDGLAEPRAIKLLRPIAEAIDTIHQQGFVHHHFNARNIQIRPDGLPILLDVGLPPFPSSFHDGAPESTPRVDTTWMAPEQAEAFLTDEISLSGFLDDVPPEVTSAANHYTFGILSYVLLTGEMPWADDSPQNRVNVIKLTDQLHPLEERKPEIRTQVAAWVMRLLSRAPQNRPDQCTVVLDAIDQDLVPEEESGDAPTTSETPNTDSSAQSSVNPDESTTAEAPPPPPVVQTQPSPGYWATVWKRLKKSPSGMAGLFIVVLLVLVAATAPLLANNKPIMVSYQHNNESHIAFPAFTNYVDSWVPWESWREVLRDFEVESDTRQHTIQEGQSLADIAEEHFNNRGRTSEILAANPSLITAHPELYPPGLDVDSIASPSEAQLAEYSAVRDQKVADPETLTAGDVLEIPVVYRPFSNHYPELKMQNMSWKDLRAYAGSDADGDGSLELWDTNGDGVEDHWDMSINWAIWPVVEWDPMDFDYGVQKKKPDECQVAHQVDDGIQPRAGCGPCPSEEELNGASCRLTDGHLLGTDDQSRDITARLIHGTVVAMLVGVISMSIAGSIGILLGLIAGFFGGWVDMVLSRITEIVMCFPRFFLIIAVIAFIEKSMVNIMVVIGLVGWTHIFRLVRGEVLRTRSLDYVAAARSMGASSWRIMTRHVLPNSISPVFVALAFGIARAVLMETGLSVLGFGDTNVPSWGEIVMQGRNYISEGAWHLTILPGIAIFITLTGFNLFGQGLRDAMDPKLRD